MLRGLYLAAAQLGDRRIRAVALRAALIGAAIFVFLALAAIRTLDGLSGVGWVDWSIRLLGVGAAFALGLVLFPGLAGIAISFMLEDIARAVEARHYPGLPPPREQPLGETLTAALRFAGTAVALNLLCFAAIAPAMLATVVLAPFIPFVFFVLNGYLLGREYFEFAAVRRLGSAPGKALRRRNRSRLFLCGLAIAALMAVPVLNWLMPVVAVAYMVHVFEDLRTR